MGGTIATLQFGQQQLESHLWEAANIYEWYRGFKDVEGVARVVTLDEISTNDHNLNMSRYVEPNLAQETLTVDQAMKCLREAAQAAFAAEDKLIRILKDEAPLK